MSRLARLHRVLPSVAMFALFALAASRAAAGPMPDDLIHKPYDLDTGLTSRSISFENPTGAPGEGGKAANSKLGVGRKGAPARSIKPGETVRLCDIEGPGTLRHIWMTCRGDGVYRQMVVRGYWEGQEHPSIECPLGDFFGFAHSEVNAYQSAVHSLGPKAGMNIWLPMPFNKRARFTITNEGDQPTVLYYQIDYTLDPPFPAETGRLHVCFRRENPTTLKKDFELLPQRNQRGRFIGSLMGIRSEKPDWWGEGEVKAYLDGDTEFPTLCGTGAEDYVGLSWGIQEVQFLYNGCVLNRKDANGHTFVTMYRWHLPDPIIWRESARITIQQISWSKNVGLAETQDDWSCATFWYEPVPSAPLPTMPSVEERVKNSMARVKSKQ